MKLMKLGGDLEALKFSFNRVLILITVHCQDVTILFKLMYYEYIALILPRIIWIYHSSKLGFYVSNARLNL